MVTESFTNKKKLVCNKKPESKLRKTLVKCYVWNISLYGCGTWTMGKRQRDWTKAFEMGYAEKLRTQDWW